MLQVTDAVRSCVLPSVNVPVAANCCDVPRAIEGLWGVTAIETSPAEVTVSTTLPLIDPDVALTLAVPVATLVAKPWLLLALLMVAVETLSELHCTADVKSSVLPSVRVPVAMNCCVVPSGMEARAGVTAMDTRVGEVTVTEVDPTIDPEVAVTLVLPAVTPETMP